MQGFIEIAKITKPFGIKGEVHVIPYSDNIDKFLGYNCFFYKENDSFLTLTIDSYKKSGSSLIIKFKEFSSRNQVERFRNLQLYISKDVLKQLDNNEYYVIDLIGCKVIFNNIELGEVIDIKNFGTCDLFEVIINKKTFYVPFLQKHIEKIDLNNNQICFLDIEEFIS